MLVIAALAAALLGASCADLAASSGTRVDHVVSGVHDEVRTVQLIAEAGLQDPPAPAVTLTAVLDDTASALGELREDAEGLPGPNDELLALIDDSTALVDQTRSAVQSGDRTGLRRSQERAAETAAAVAEWSTLL
ncbi:hypothetical protein GCM10028833_40340 [Glycomyces tarimensis]